MKKTTVLFLISLILLTSLFPAERANAQGNGPILHVEQVDVSAFPSLSLRINAWDASGLPLADLQASDVSLSEDGGAAYHPASIQADREAALGVALVLDISSSMTGAPLADAKVAAARFLDRLKPGDRAALIAFSDNVNPDPAVLDPSRELNFTTDLAPVYDLIESLTPRNSTQLYNAATKAVRMVSNQPAGHRAILLLTDGRNEPAEIGNPDEAIGLAKAANVPFFVIGLGDKIDETYLRRLASETGGLYRAAPKSSELARLFGETATLLKTQYLLSFTSSIPADGANHQLKISINTAQGQAEATTQFGPLPAAAPTATVVPPTSTPTSVPTAEPTVQLVVAQPAPTSAVPVPQVSFSLIRDWAWPLAVLVALVFAILFVSRKKRRPAPIPEVCAQCGHDLTGKPGSCPQCGGTRRLPK